MNRRQPSTALGLATVLALLAAGVEAAPVITNGGFESGLTGWSVSNLTGSFGTFSSQTGAASPVSGDAVPPPPGGTRAAMSDSEGPGSHVLYQDFVASSGASTLSFDLFIGNRGDRFTTPATLDFSIAAINQQLRVDIIKTTADLFSITAADILQTLYTSGVGDPLISGFRTINVDVSGLLAANNGQTLRLRFAEVDNLAPLQMGVDNVGFGQVPEPATLLLSGTALLALRWMRWRAAAA